MRKQVLVSALALIAAVAVPVALPLAVPVGAQATTVTIPLAAQNDSGQSGTATLSAEGAQTRVVLDLANSPAGPQPAHIHTGACGPTLGGVAFALEFPRDGKSTSLVNTPLSAVQTGGFAINVHKSPQEASVYVACGNIPAVAGQAQPAASPATAPAKPAAPAAPVTAPAPPAPTTAAPAKPVASPAVQMPAALPRTGDGSALMSALPAIAGALGVAGLGLGFAVRRFRR